jgi:superfamily II DNA/RNA helicase
MFLRVDPHLKKLQAICLANTLELVLQTYGICEDVTTYSKFSIGWCARDDFTGSEDVQILVGTPSAVLSNVTEGRKLDVSHVNLLIVD